MSAENASWEYSTLSLDVNEPILSLRFNGSDVQVKERRLMPSPHGVNFSAYLQALAKATEDMTDVLAEIHAKTSWDGFQEEPQLIVKGWRALNAEESARFYA